MVGACSPSPFPSTSCICLRRSIPLQAVQEHHSALLQHKTEEQRVNALQRGCVCSVLSSATLLPVLAHSVSSSWLSPTPPRDLHNAHGHGEHSPAPPADPALPGCGGQLLPSSAQRKGKRKKEKKLFLPLTTAALLPSNQTPSQPNPPAPERGQQESPAGSKVSHIQRTAPELLLALQRATPTAKPSGAAEASVLSLPSPGVAAPCRLP